MDEALTGGTATVSAGHFPYRTWMISLAGWMFDFYDLADRGKSHALSATG